MKSQYSLKQEKVFFFQARESFLYIRHGLASVGANNVFAKCVLANCEKRSLLGNCQPSVNRFVRACGDAGVQVVLTDLNLEEIEPL